MKCPYCGFDDSKVTDSRAADDGVRRRRECLSCGERFTTYERLDRNDLLVVKRDGRREQFDREKLLAGLRIACRKRPLPTGVIEAIADDIEARARAEGRAEIASRDVGELAMARLRDADQIAYIRFASVYREFHDIDELKREVAELEARPPVAPPQLPLLGEEELRGLSRPRAVGGTGQRKRGRGRGERTA